MSLAGLIEIALHRLGQRRAERQPPRPRLRSQAGDQRRRQPDREHRRALRHHHPVRSIDRCVHIPTRLTLRQRMLRLQSTHGLRRRTVDQQLDRAVHANRVLVGISPAAGHQPLEYHASRPTPPRRPPNQPLKLELCDCVGAVISPVLCNVYLHRLDRQWARRGTGVLCRYADDRAPRTRKEELSRSRVRRMRCCARDEGARPTGLAVLRGRPAGGGRKPPRGAPVKSRGAELAETARHRARQVWITKASESEPLMRRRKRIGDIETRVESLLWDEPGGCLLIGQAVSGVKVARAWSGLSCGTREPVAPTGWLASGAVVACGRLSRARTPSSGNCEGESSCAGHRGGPSRISVEGSVIGLERRGRVVRAGSAINRPRAGGVG